MPDFQPQPAINPDKRTPALQEQQGMSAFSLDGIVMPAGESPEKRFNFRTPGQCIIKSDNPDDIAEMLKNHFIAKGIPEEKVPVKIVTTPDEEVLVLCGKLYDIYRLYEHTRMLLNSATAIMEESHCDDLKLESAIVKKNDKNNCAITFSSFKKFDSLADRFDKIFYSTIKKFPHYSKSKEDDTLHDYKGLYRSTNRKFNSSKPGIGKYITSRLGHIVQKTAAAIGIKSNREEVINSVSNRLRNSFTESDLDKRFRIQLKNLDRVKSPVKRLRYTLLVIAETVDELRGHLGGLYQSEKRLTKSFNEIPAQSPIGKFPVEKKGWLSLQSQPMKLVPLAPIVARDWKEGLISHPLDEAPELRDVLSLARVNYEISSLHKSGTKIPFRNFIQDCQNLKTGSLSMIREGKRVSFIAETEQGPMTVPLGFVARDAGEVFLVVPDMKRIREITRDENTDVAQCTILETSASDGEIEAELLSFGDDRILNIDFEQEQVEYVEPDSKNYSGWWSRKWGGKSNPHEYLRLLGNACDRFRKDLDDCEFKNRTVLKRRVSTIGEDRWGK